MAHKVAVENPPANFRSAPSLQPALGQKYINGTFLPTKELRETVQQNVGCTGNIAAIDFGTTSCSLAYSVAGGSKIRFLRIDDADKERVPSAILMDADGKVIDFGRKARRKFAKSPRERRQHYHYFSEIKMALQHDKEVNWETTVMSLQQKEFYLVEVIALTLKYLKDKLLDLEEVCKGLTGVLRASDFSWVITVPAMWKARGKDMMRQAAYLAGIASDEEPIIKLTLISKENGCYSSRPAKPNASLVKPQSLYLALEPESAALYCIECAKKDKPSCASSTCYMILDIGGGTVDITAHKVSDAGTIQAILPPRGNDWGGKKINEEFKFFLGNLVGDPTFERYISTGDTETNSKHSADLDMIINQSFEEEKRVFGDKKDHTQEDEILINLPYSFIQTYRQDLEKGIRELNCNDVQFSGDELMLSYIKMDDLFSQSVEEIISCVSECVREVERQCKLASVFFVGGYGGSKYLLGKIRDTLDCRIKTYCPLDHKTAVVSGAVLFHQNPAVIRSRVADATYGAACAIVFDPTIHEQDYAYYDDDHNKKCNSILQPFIIKDDIIDAKYILTKTYKPHVHFLTIMHFEIYTTSSKTIKYICGPRGEKLSEVHKIGELSVQMPDTATDKDREVKLMFDFTHTEIQVEAYDLTSGMKACTTVDFLSDI